MPDDGPMTTAFTVIKSLPGGLRIADHGNYDPQA